ncbi:MAG: ABC transporter permease subunit [Clostridia bacterium]|nr:ABC transporter permease subunit [Clostridia bacterium]
MSEQVIRKNWKAIVWKHAWQTLVALALLAVCWIGAHWFVGNELLVPDFFDCLKSIGELLTDGAFYKAFLKTLLRVLTAFFCSVAPAGIFAVIAYLSPTFRGILSPIVSALRSLPALAVLLIVLVWTGAGIAPIVIAFLSLFPMLYTGFLSALFSVNSDLVEMSRVYNVPTKRRIFSLYLPNAAPYALRESGAALAFSLKLVVSAEVLASTYQSVGGMMQEARLYLEMPTLFALVALTFFVGIVLESLISCLAYFVERRVK